MHTQPLHVCHLDAQVKRSLTHSSPFKIEQLVAQLSQPEIQMLDSATADTSRSQAMRIGMGSKVILPFDPNTMPGVKSVDIDSHRLTMGMDSGKRIVISRPPFAAVDDDSYDVYVEEGFATGLMPRLEIMSCGSGSELTSVMHEIVSTPTSERRYLF